MAGFYWFILIVLLYTVYSDNKSFDVLSVHMYSKPALDLSLTQDARLAPLSLFNFFSTQKGAGDDYAAPNLQQSTLRI